MAQTTPRTRRDWMWYAAAYGVLAAGTGVAAVLLMTHNIAQQTQVVTDPQATAERLAAWRAAAILAYTSGSELGHVCAVLAGLLAAQAVTAQAVAVRTWRTGLGMAVAAGAVLALVNLSVAWWAASARLTEDARLAAEFGDLLDPALRPNLIVIAGIALVAAAYVMLAVLGYVLGRTNHARVAFAAMFVLAITAPFSHLYLTYFLIWGTFS